MTHHTESPEYDGLKFFGKINASISHEIRNALAVINENAGLIKDLIMMSEKGHPLDLERVSGRVEKVLEQVRRTDRIVDNMNRFAHSIDNTFTKIDACDYVEFVVRLTERFADMKGIKLRLDCPSEPIEIATSPFLFENLIFHCLDQAMQNPGEAKTIVISVQKIDGIFQFQFKGIAPETDPVEKLLTVSANILNTLGAKLKSNKDFDSFALDIQKESDI